MLPRGVGGSLWAYEIPEHTQHRPACFMTPQHRPASCGKTPVPRQTPTLDPSDAAALARHNQLSGREKTAFFRANRSAIVRAAAHTAAETKTEPAYAAASLASDPPLTKKEKQQARVRAVLTSKGILRAK